MALDAPPLAAAPVAGGPGVAVDARHSRTPALAALLRRPTVAVALAILVLFAVGTVFAPQLAPDNPLTQDVTHALLPPFWAAGGSLSHPLGTDELGRDMLSRLMYGGRPALALAFAAAITSATIGLALGLLAGVKRGAVGAVIMWLVDAQLGFPYVVLALAVVTVRGSGFGVLYVMLSIFGWVQFARLVRAESERVMRSDYVLAARAAGTRGIKLVTRHVLPNVVSPVLVLLTFSVAIVLLIESGLSFLGVGVQPPNADWGSMLATGRTYIYEDGWYAVFPGLVILFTVLAVNTLGLAVRDVLNPRRALRP